MTIAHRHPASLCVPRVSALALLFPHSELSTLNFKLSISPLNPFPSHHSRTRAGNSFPLIPLQKTGGTPPSWSDQFTSLSDIGRQVPAASYRPVFTGHWSRITGHILAPVSPFPASLTQKQGVYMLWSYHAPKTKPLLQAAFLHWPLVAGHRSLVAFSTPPFTRSAFFRAAGLSPLASLIDSRLRIGAWPGETSENA